MRRTLLALLLPLAVLTGAARAEVVERVDSVAITVSDLERALQFNTGVLPFAGEAYERLCARGSRA